MRNLKKQVAIMLAVCMFSVLCVQTAFAEVKVKIVNNRNYSVSVAFCWSAFDYPDNRRSGWYIVNPGETKTITFKDAVYALTSYSFGYYATGKSQDGSKVLVWSGKDTQTDTPLDVIIHPTKAFGGHPDDAIPGGKKVRFKNMKITEVEDGTRMNGTATLTFKN